VTISTLHITTRVLSGPGAADQLGEAACELGARRAMIVTDPGVAEAGHAEHAKRSIESAGLAAEVFSAVHENPTTADAEACRQVATVFGPDLFVGVGGGSSIDTARAGNMLLTNGGRMQDYWGVGKVPGPMLPFIALPTTTGTGSEMQSFALIVDAESGQKMACGDKKAASALAILDPTLAATQPKSVKAVTGLDCISHALESAVSSARTPFSQVFSMEAWRLASSSFEGVLTKPDDVDALEAMQRAAAFAGLAIEHSMLGAAHAMANPLTAQFGVTHGEAVGTMLPHVVRFNAESAEARAAYERIAMAADLAGIDGLIGWLEGALRLAGLPGRLRGYGVGAGALASLSSNAAKQWTGRFNPRPITVEQWRGLYEQAL